ncbi:MAG: methyl-accepting chemotaxis protein [Pseudomonadota bacterium]
MFRAFIRNSSIAGRLGAGFGAVLSLLLAVAVVSGFGMQDMAGQLDHITEVNAHKIRLARDLMNDINALAVHVRNVALLTDIQKMDAEAKEVVVAKARYEKTQLGLVALLQSASASDQEREAVQRIVNISRRALPLMERAAQQGSDGDNTSAVATLTTQVQPEETLWRKEVSQLVDLQDQLSARAASQARSHQRHTLVTMLLLVAASLAAGGVISWRITRSVTQPVQQAMLVAERIAQCDLTSVVEVHATDETGRLLEAIGSMQDRLRHLVSNILQSADAIEAASAEVAMGNQDLSNRTEQTAASLQQAASSLSELTDTVRRSVDAASNGDHMAASAAELAARGGAIVADVVATMDDIQASSGKISDITSVINGIAFQTNILALNAAVEAARAGEHGRGFAVVASEVRSLAGRAAEAASAISKLIGTSVQRVRAGSVLVGDAGRTMKDVVDSVQRVSGIVGSISAASVVQADEIALVNGSVGLLDSMTQQNAALVEQSAASAASLQEQAHHLAQLVAVFKLA